MSNIKSKEIANIFSEISAANYKGLFNSDGWLSGKVKKTDLFEKGATKYVESLEEKFNVIRIFGMNRFVPLRKVYVRVNILEKITSKIRATVDELETQFDRDTRGFGLVIKTIDGTELVSSKYFQISHNTIMQLQKIENLRKYVSDRLQNLQELIGKKYKEKDQFINALKIELVRSEKLDSSEKFKTAKRFVGDKNFDGFQLIDKYEKYILELSECNQKYIVLGKPGSGKTTFFKSLIIHAIDGKIAKGLIPIFVGLKDYSDSGKNLLDFIFAQFDICQLPITKSFILKLFEKGKCLLLFDGLDEVSNDNINEVIKELLNISEKFNKNKILISCRIAAYNYWFEKFDDVELADFNDNQIENFISNWFADEMKTASSCWSELKKNAPIKELGSNPLLLTLLCLAFDENLQFPRNRSELYKDAIDALLKRWDSTRRIIREDAYKYLSVRRKESMFSAIAVRTFTNHQYFLPRRTLEKYIADYIVNLSDHDKNSALESAEGILKSIEAQHGIFVERAKNIYSFSHLTFQEYFTAMYIVDNIQQKSLNYLIDNYILSDQWREVFLLVSGMLYEVNEFLNLMKQKIDKLAINLGLTEFLKTVNNLSLYEEYYSELLCKCVAIIYSLTKGSGDILEKEFNNEKSLNTNLNLMLKIVNTMNLEIFHKGFGSDLMRSKIKDLSTFHDFAYLFDKISSQVILDKQSTVLQQEKINDKLTDYLKANLRLVECINSDCYISKYSREKIINSLFTLSSQA